VLSIQRYVLDDSGKKMRRGRRQRGGNLGLQHIMPNTTTVKKGDAAGCLSPKEEK